MFFCFCLVKGVICYLPPFTRIRKILKRCFSKKQQQKARKKRMTWWLDLEPVVPGSDDFHAKVCVWLSFWLFFFKGGIHHHPAVVLFFWDLRIRFLWVFKTEICSSTGPVHVDNRKGWSNFLWSLFLLTIGDYPAGWSRVFPLKVYSLV